MVVYSITNPIGQVYIGKTKNFKARIAAHKNMGIFRTKLGESVKRFGFDSHVASIIKKCESVDEMDILEIQLIKKNFKKGISLNSNSTGKEKKQQRSISILPSKEKRILKLHKSLTKFLEHCILTNNI